jgi:hypothetical protein
MLQDGRRNAEGARYKVILLAIEPETNTEEGGATVEATRASLKAEVLFSVLRLNPHLSSDRKTLDTIYQRTLLALPGIME